MHNSEWSLILFTVLGQFSAGLTTGLLILHLSGLQKTGINLQQTLRKAIMVAALCMVVAMLASFFHLSAPLASVYALSNLKHSWLSREILMVSIFTGLLAITAIQIWHPGKVVLKSPWLLLLTTVAGWLLIYTMARIYMLPTVPAWNTPHTLIRFFTGGFITGIGFLLIFPGLSQIKPLYSDNSRILYIFAGIISAALLIRLAGSFLAGSTVPDENIAFVPQIPLTAILLPWILWFTGCILLIWQVLKPTAQPTRSGNLKKLAFILIIVAAFIDRYFFYESFYRLGI